MRAIIILALSFIISCQDSSSVKMINYEHANFDIQYPETWQNLEKEGTLLSISKYTHIISALHGGNPNLLIIAGDSIELSVSDGIANHKDYLDLLKESVQNNEGTVLKEDIKRIELNGDSIYSMKFESKGKEVTFLQTLYLFSANGRYYGFIATNPVEDPDQELIDILNSLKIKRYQSLEKILKEH